MWLLFLFQRGVGPLAFLEALGTWLFLRWVSTAFGIPQNAFLWEEGCRDISQEHGGRSDRTGQWPQVTQLFRLAAKDQAALTHFSPWLLAVPLDDSTVRWKPY